MVQMRSSTAGRTIPLLAECLLSFGAVRKGAGRRTLKLLDLRFALTAIYFDKLWHHTIYVRDTLVIVALDLSVYKLYVRDVNVFVK